MISHWRSGRSIALGFALCSFIMAGCGEDEPAPSTVGTSPDPAAPTAPATGTETAPSNDLIRTSPTGRKMLVDIPLEVWIDDPLAVVAQQGTVPQSNNVANAVTPTIPDPGTPTTVTTPDPAPTEAASAVKWDEVIAMPILDAEVKAIRNQLATSVQSVGAFNASQNEIPPMIPMQTNVLAALSLIAEQHSGTALWKDQAPALRELALLVRSNAEGLGRKPFEATQLEFEKIEKIFNGSTPDLAEEPEPKVPFGDKIEMLQVMHRMQKAYNWLSSNTPTDAALKEVKEKAQHEVAMLNAILHVVADPSFVVSEEEDYQNFFKSTLANVEGMQQALDNDNFDLFKMNVGEIYGKCSACHNAYK